MKFDNIKDIQKHISSVVSEKIEAGLIVRMAWVTREILSELGEIFGENCDFYIITSRYYVEDQVKRCIKRFEPDFDGDVEQLVLEGFTHLQKAYPVDRDGERQIVPVDMLTDDELESRAKEYEAMAAGCRTHAKEIRKYIASRGGAQGVYYA